MPRITQHPSYLAARVALAPGTSSRTQRFALEAASRALQPSPATARASSGMSGMGAYSARVGRFAAELRGMGAAPAAPTQAQFNAFTNFLQKEPLIVPPFGTPAPTRPQLSSGNVLDIWNNNEHNYVGTVWSPASVADAKAKALAQVPNAPLPSPVSPITPGPATAKPIVPVIASPAPTTPTIPVAVLPAPAPIAPPPAVMADGTVCKMADGSVGAYLGGVCMSATSNQPVAVIATPVPPSSVGVSDGAACHDANGFLSTYLGGVCQMGTEDMAAPSAAPAPTAYLPPDGTTCYMADGTLGSYTGGVCSGSTPSTPVSYAPSAPVGAACSLPAGGYGSYDANGVCVPQYAPVQGATGAQDGAPCTMNQASGVYSSGLCEVPDGTPCVADDGSGESGTFSAGQCWWGAPNTPTVAVTPTAASSGLSPMMQLILALIEARFGVGTTGGAAAAMGVPDGTPCTASDGSGGLYQSGVCASSSTGALYGAPSKESF